MNCRKTTLFWSAALCALSIQAAPARAQDAGNGADVDADEIVVTATRNETLASRTPVALTAVTGEALIAQGVTNPVNLSDTVPNLSIDRNNGLQITIRGVTSSDNTEKGDPSAAFMLDGIYIARAQVQEVSFFDVQRVEVLRGPQGTLFGRNTTAGLVNTLTNAPELGRFGGSFDAAFGNYDNSQITGVVNLPVGESVAIRAAANYDARDSFYRAPAGYTDPNPYKRNYSGRLSALFESGNARLLLRGDYSAIRGQAGPSVPTYNFYRNVDAVSSGAGYRLGVNPIYIGNGKSADDLLSIRGMYKGSLARRNETWGVMADFSYDLGPVVLNYLGSYREFDRDEHGAGTIYGGVLTIPTTFVGHYKQNSQELRLSTGGSGPIKAQAGLYYFNEKSSVDYTVFGLLNPVPGRPGYVYSFRQDPTKAESLAAFGQVTWSLTPELRVTGGIRYSHDEKSRVGGTFSCGTVACNGAGDGSTKNDAKRTFSKTTWRAGIDYDLGDRTLLYAVVSTGYKAGGFNDGCADAANPLCGRTEDTLYYKPETLTSYEAGVKTRFLDNAVRLNLAAFHYDYTNIQLSQITGSPPVTRTTNAAKAKIDGVEVEGIIKPAANTRVDFAVTWLNARYDDYRLAPTVDWKGRKLDRSPEFTFNTGITQTVGLGSVGRLDLSARTRVSDSYYLASLANQYQFRVPGFTRTDLSATYHAPDDSWYLQGYVKNVENSIVVTAASVAEAPLIAVADPRTYGVRAGIRF